MTLFLNNLFLGQEGQGRFEHKHRRNRPKGEGRGSFVKMILSIIGVFWFHTSYFILFTLNLDYLESLHKLVRCNCYVLLFCMYVYEYVCLCFSFSSSKCGTMFVDPCWMRPAPSSHYHYFCIYCVLHIDIWTSSSWNAQIFDRFTIFFFVYVCAVFGFITDCLLSHNVRLVYVVVVMPPLRDDILIWFCPYRSTHNPTD